MLKIHYFKPYCAGSKFHRKTLKFHSLLNKIDLNPQKKKLDRLAKKKHPNIHIYNIYVYIIGCFFSLTYRAFFFRIKIDLIKQTLKF